MIEEELRGKLSHTKLKFSITLSKKDRYTIYLIKPVSGYYYYITVHKKVMGLLSIYKDLVAFKDTDVVGYINKVADYSGLSLKDICETDIYLNNEAVHTFEKIIRLDEYGYYFEGPSQVRIYTEDHLMWSYDAVPYIKDTYIQMRLKKLRERQNSRTTPTITPPWAFEMPLSF
jgi:hypothetical protein